MLKRKTGSGIQEQQSKTSKHDEWPRAEKHPSREYSIQLLLERLKRNKSNALLDSGIAIQDVSSDWNIASQRKDAGIVTQSLGRQTRRTGPGKMLRDVTRGGNAPIRAILTKMYDWLIDENEWTKICLIWIEHVRNLRTSAPEKVKDFKFGTNVDIVIDGKDHLPRLRIHLDKAIHSVGINGNKLHNIVIREVMPLLANTRRTYGAADYAMISAAIFVDPAGSSAQEFHEDLHGFDRHAVWNVLFPIQLPIGVGHIAQSRLMDVESGFF